MPIAPAAGKTPERRSAPRASSSKPVAQTVTGMRDKREAAVTELADMAALGLLMAKNPADAGAVSQHGPAIAHELALIADSDEKVAAFLDRLSTVGPYAGLAKAAIPLALQIAVNHKRLPSTMAGTMGILDPADLEAMVELKAAKMRAEVEQELTAVRKQMAELNGSGIGARSHL